MVKAELTEKVAMLHNLKMTEAQRVVDTMFSAMTQALAQGEGIEIRGFASFKIKRYSGHPGRNPRTGAPIEVREKVGVVFKPGMELKQRVNQDRPRHPKMEGRERAMAAGSPGAEKNT
jgi:integration host factor subunit beta